MNKYNRVVLKLSGEALAGEQGYGIDPTIIKSIATQIREIVELEVEVAVVVGAGNIWRGMAGSAQGMDRATADYMGMLATVMNSLALQDSLESIGVESRVQTSIEMRQVQSLIFVEKRFVILRRSVLLFLQLEQGTHTFQLILLLRYVRRKSRQKSS